MVLPMMPPSGQMPREGARGRCTAAIAIAATVEQKLSPERLVVFYGCFWVEAQGGNMVPNSLVLIVDEPHTSVSGSAPKRSPDLLPPSCRDRVTG